MANLLSTPTICGPGKMPIAITEYWAVNNDEDDATPAVELKGAPGAGFSLYLTDFTISWQAQNPHITLKDSDGTVLFGPFTLQATGSSDFTKHWKYPLKLGDNLALEVLATDSLAFTVYVEGFTGQLPIT